MEPGSPNEVLKPIEFLIGKWVSTSAEGSYPTIKDFKYCEELSFKSYGQPLLHYESQTWHPVSKKPMHMENGFLRIKPGTNKVSFIVAHNFGLTTIEEGTIDGKKLSLNSTNIGRISFAKEPNVTAISRVFDLKEDGTLELALSMATSTHEELHPHLRVCYKKVE